MLSIELTHKVRFLPSKKKLMVYVYRTNKKHVKLDSELSY